jgi:hypothetical protein
MRIIIIDSGQPAFLTACMESFRATAGELCAPTIVAEKGRREATLNYILSTWGGEDMCIFSDDIIFTPGWYQALERNMSAADIIGFSMLYPASDIVQDRGYELAEVNGEIELAARDRGKARQEVPSFEYAAADAVNGCALFLKGRVTKDIPSILPGGANRWEEFIYLTQARRKGYTIAVLEHYLYHHGKSTKAHPDKQLSSESHLIEQPLWQDMVRQYVDPAWVCQQKHWVMDPALRALLLNGNLFLYGAGVVSFFLLNELSREGGAASLRVCSGLPEEYGMELLGKHIESWENIGSVQTSSILITVRGKEQEICALLRGKFKNIPCYEVTYEEKGETITLGVKQI